ncbi:M20/M25/M40 family metallo-hydrolase [Blastomonas sp.]|uniref:M20/M25/M40 family metallo-hydrolase n=1 Tax=Blastomonas sp. TaxID=1909299 RepID=UPI0026229329|nr:M20/M25/M40 family metallo-hydrolase [Blastomonas sp.]MDM7958108.1 M20/M25/M40 family metallo-hydrolase [Blastomonas sp.]
MAFRTFIAALALSASFAAPALAQDIAAAKTALAGDYDRIVKELITITEIPAPPFGEQARAEYFAKAFKDLGLAEVAIDAEGNVTGLRRGTVAAGGALVVVSAHLDTVFPKGTDVTVRREGNTLNAPGVGDDTVGLTGLLAWVRALNAAKVPTRHDVLFVATVGEEGPGDLRGVRHLFTKNPYKGQIAAFISVDGSDPSRIVNQAVGSKRYNIAFTGPGGHSYGAFGIVNPMAAMADAVKRLYETDVPASPRTSFAASVVSGGTSVNSIPDRIELQVDMRSPDPKALERLEKRFLAIVDEAVAAENYARSTNLGEVGAEKTRIGDRPAGATADKHQLVVTSQKVLAEHGFQTQLLASSTDSNIPMSLGVPAITVGTGGGGGRAHSVDEYVNIERNAFIGGLSSGMALLVAVADLDWTAK